MSRTSKTQWASPGLWSVQKLKKMIPRLRSDACILFTNSISSHLLQMLVYFFYAVPLVSILLYGLNTPGCSWMLDWTIFFAGAMAQVQSIAKQVLLGFYVMNQSKTLGSCEIKMTNLAICYKSCRGHSKIRPKFNILVFRKVTVKVLSWGGRVLFSATQS